MKTTITFFAILFTIALITAGPTFGQTSFSQEELTPTEQLGKHLFFDKIASPDNMSCADCHAPSTGFTGPIPGINKKGSIYQGAVPQRFGNRKPPSAAYATLSPVFHYDAVEELFIGGNFWDGRATGEHLGNPAADQALGPFLNPVEQNNASKLDVLMQVASSKYVYLWDIVWGEPLSYDTQAEIDVNYDRIGLAIAAYENSDEVNQFTSKFDYYLQGMVDLTDEEMMGMNLFNGDALCAECHISEQGPNGEPPLFTDFTFDNLGVPKNPKNPFYKMDKVYLDNGDPINPMGDAWIDNGLGGFLATHSNPAWQAMAAENMGKQKVPTLRNVDKRPGNGFTKAYMHNGVFKSLKEVVNFYNTRDVGMWPPPEVPQNVNTDELGDLGLTDAEEDAIVAFMKTLSDGYDITKDIPADGNYPAGIELAVGPNPFSTNTFITLTLPADSFVEIAVYNLQGEKVSVLKEGQMRAGTSETVFDATDLQNGIYIIAVSAGNRVLSHKISLIN